MTLDKNQSGLFEQTDTDLYGNTETETGEAMTETVYEIHCNKCGCIGIREDQLDAVYLRDSHDCLEISMRIEEVDAYE